MIRPLNDKVLIQLAPQKEYSDTGALYIPELARPETVEATVVALGPKVDKEIEIGRKILIDQYSGADVIHGDIPLRIINVNQILAVVK